MPQLKNRELDGGVVVSVKAKQGSHNNEIRGVHDGYRVIAVTAIAKKGRANDAIIKLLAKRLGMTKSRLTIVAGETSSTELVQVDAVSADRLQDHVAGL